MLTSNAYEQCSKQRSEHEHVRNVRTNEELLTLLGNCCVEYRAQGGLKKMPNRYGENDDPDVARITDHRAIDVCELCDDNGMRGMFVCDHVDHAAAARRGKAMCEQALEKARKNRLASTQSREKASRVVGGAGAQ